MTTINKNFVRAQKQFSGVPWGNLTGLQFNFTTASTGVFTDSDLTTAVQSADVVRLGVLPQGMTLFDCLTIISDAFSTSTTASIGFSYVDGVDSTTVPQSATYFASALATDSTGVSRKTAVTAPVTLPKDAYLTLTIGGAAHGSVGIMDLVVIGIETGSN